MGQRRGASRKWTDERVRAELSRYANGEGQIVLAAVARDNPQLYEICRHHYGTFVAAVERFGFRPERQLRKWDADRVLAEIRQRQAQGQSLRSADVRRSDIPLYGAACKRFQSWGGALQAAGIDTADHNARAEPSDAELRTQVLAQRASGSPALPPALVRSIRRRYETVEQFYQQSGLSRRWTRDSILQAIRDSAPATATATFIRHEHPGLYFAAIREFGRWVDAMAAAFPGLTPDRPRTTQNAPRRSRVRGQPPWADGHGRWLLPQAKLDAAWVFVVSTPPGRRIRSRDMAESIGVSIPTARRLLASLAKSGAVSPPSDGTRDYRRASDPETPAPH